MFVKRKKIAQIANDILKDINVLKNVAVVNIYSIKTT